MEQGCFILWSGGLQTEGKMGQFEKDLTQTNMEPNVYIALVQKDSVMLLWARPKTLGASTLKIKACALSAYFKDGTTPPNFDLEPEILNPKPL